MLKVVARLIRSGSARTLAAVAALLVLAVVTAAIGIWVFREPTGRGTVWDLVVEDRWTLGFLRLALLIGGAYLATSAVAHIANGRWIRALSTSGVEVDRSDVDQRIQALEIQVEDLVRQRDLAYLLLEGHVGG